MSYFSYSEDQSLGSSLGCGPSCSCGPCRSGMSGFAEWYEKEQQDEPAAAPPATPAPPAESSQTGSLKGLGYAELPGPTTTPISPAPPLVTESAVLQNALRRGIRSPRRLTNILFFTRHPSRLGTPILANEVTLINEWRQILDQIVLPALRQTFGPPNTPVAPLRVSPRLGRYY
jgi:hypothetical protein